MTGKRVKSKKTGRTGWRYRFKDPNTGQRIKRIFWYSEEKLARNALQKYCEERQKLADNLPSSNGRRMPYDALIKKFIDEAPIASVRRRNDLKRRLENNPLKLKSAAELFDRGRLTSACRQLLEQGEKRCVFNLVQIPLKQVTAWAESVGLFETDPLRSWKRLPWCKKGKGSMGLGVTNVRLILQAVAALDEVYRRKYCSLVPILALLTTGCRNTAVFSARVDDLKNNRIVLSAGNGKKRNGVATMPVEFVKILRQSLEYRGARKSDEPLLVTPDGTEINLTNILKNFKRAVVLAAVRIYWPAKPEYAIVEPISVAHRLYTGKLQGHDGSPPKSAEKLKSRQRLDGLVETIACEIEANVKSWCARKTLYSLRKSHITWARQLVGTDVVRIQVGHAPRPEDQDVETDHYVEDDLLNPALSSEAVWDHLLGKKSLDKKEHEACFEIYWSDGRVYAGPIKSGPVVAPEQLTVIKEMQKASFPTVQTETALALIAKPSLRFEPRTYALRKRVGS